jgi:transposase
MSHERKHHTPEEKVVILRRHLVDRVPVSTLCDEHQLHPTAFYRWLKQFFGNGAAAFGPASRANQQGDAREQRIAFLEAKLKKKDEVLAELMEEHVTLKKSLGEIRKANGFPTIRATK